jgi:hypothetical protein
MTTRDDGKHVALAAFKNQRFRDFIGIDPESPRLVDRRERLGMGQRLPLFAGGIEVPAQFLVNGHVHPLRFAPI